MPVSLTEEAQMAAPVVARIALDVDYNFALRRELDRVSNKVHEDLAQPHHAAD